MKILFFSFLLFGFQFLSLGQHQSLWLGDRYFEGVNIYGVLQDREYNYWFASSEGLIKHDGYSYVRYSCPEMNGSSVFNLTLAPDGTIFCSNLNKQIFQIKKDTCRLFFTIPDASTDISIAFNQRLDVYINSGYQIHQLNKSGKLIKSIRPKIKNYLGPLFQMNDSIVLVDIENQDLMFELWRDTVFELQITSKQLPRVVKFFPIQESLYALEPQTNRFYKVEKGKNSYIFQKKGTVSCFEEQAFLRFYKLEFTTFLASNNGGIKEIKNENDLFEKRGVDYSNEFISYIATDHENNILLSTFQKGVRVISKGMENTSFYEELLGKNITSIQDYKNNLFVSTNTGEIYNIDSTNANLFKKVSNRLEYFYVDTTNHFLFINEGKSSKLIPLKTNRVIDLEMGSLKSVCPVDENTYFLGFNNGVFQVSFSKTGDLLDKKLLIQGRVYDIYKWNRDAYISSQNGLFKIDKRLNITEMLYKNHSIFCSSITSDLDRIVIASTNFGLIQFDGRQFNPFLKKKLHALEGKIIKQIVLRGNIVYINTNEGFYCMNLISSNIIRIHKGMGLSSNKINGFKIIDSRLYFIQNSGIQSIRLKALFNKTGKPHLRVNSILVDGKRVMEDDYIFEPETRKITLELKVPTIKNRDNVLYKFKLSPGDREWSTQTYENNLISFNALQSGAYSLSLYAEVNGVKSEVQVFSFTILKPVYLTWWFITLSVLFILVVLFLFFLRYLFLQKRKARIETELQKLKLKAIQSQMNPHFIFNALNSIQDLVLKEDIDNSYRYITRFSELVRTTLVHSDKDFIDFESEIEQLELYLILEKLRFKDDFNYVLNTNELSDILIPPMLVQPFIENALVHGLLHQTGKKELKIQFIQEEDYILCQIEDNGIGRKAAKEMRKRQRGSHEPFAISAMEQRMQTMRDKYLKNLGFEYEDLHPGTCVKIRIPYISKF